MKLIRILSEQRRHVGAGKEAFLRVDAKLLTRIDDVEVAHRKLTNTVFGGEHRIALSIVKRSGSYVRFGLTVFMIE